jgi:asparagine synthase (glutamine-hydrolysing)
MGAGPFHGVSFVRPEWREKALASACLPQRYANGYDERVHIIRNGDAGTFRKGGLAGEGIDERDPLADRRLIEFSLRIPPEHLYWNGVARPLARAALSDRLPKAVLDLKVRGLQAADWAVRFAQAEAREMLEEVSKSSTVQEILDVNRMRQAIDHWPTKDWNQRTVHFQYRVALIGALSAGMFALVHEQGASAAAETI